MSKFMIMFLFTLMIYVNRNFSFYHKTYLRASFLSVCERHSLVFKRQSSPLANFSQKDSFPKDMVFHSINFHVAVPREKEQ